MTVGIYPQDSEGAAFNDIVLELEALGFYGKAAGYVELGVYSEAALEGLEEIS